MPKALYFLAPRFEIAADSATAPRLGSIFDDLDKLTGPLNQGHELPVPNGNTSHVSFPDFQDESRRMARANVGLFASLVQGILGRVDVAYGFEDAQADVYGCETLKVTEFEPSLQYIKDSIAKSENVRHHLFGGSAVTRILDNKPIYMITGLKIAKEFSLNRSSNVEHAPGLGVSVDAAGLGAPISAGPRLELMTGSSHEVSHGPASRDIVFAYRAVVIKRNYRGEIRHRDLTGHLCSTGEDSKEKGDPPWEWDMEPIGEEQAPEIFPGKKLVTIQMQV